ncbi:DUF3489 domain-containing protein [Phenylobacterium sp.]|uniref:DUF3489 domain-containing protein n=1 Tax=Phenylobacterium sp. TaxID=1871053 RepID=UPI00286EAD2F|nr:DUF3489 domain-containing protein [Phenylobacterium sp.]
MARNISKTAGKAPREPIPAPAPPVTPKGKLGLLVGLLRRPEGVGIDELTAATGWQAHSVRGAISGAVKKNLGLLVESQKRDGIRTYFVVGEAR